MLSHMLCVPVTKLIKLTVFWLSDTHVWASFVNIVKLDISDDFPFSFCVQRQ